MKMKTVTTMKTNQRTSIFFALLAFFILALVAPSAALACTSITESDVTAGGYTISSSGDYCFTEDIATNMSSGQAIVIAADDVTIDLNGYELDDTAGSLSQAIYSNGYDNLTVRNGTIKGFASAVALIGASSSGRLLEDLVVTNNTSSAFRVDGANITVRNNSIFDITGGSGVETIQLNNADGASVINNYIAGSLAPSSHAYGIYLSSGSNVIVKDNRIVDITSEGGFAAPIYVSSTDDSVFENNYISGTSASTTTYGFKEANSSSNNVYTNNHVIDADYGFYCDSSTSWMRDNTTTGVTTLRSTCTDKGNNN